MPYPLGKYKGKRYYRFTVEITYGGYAVLTQECVYPKTSVEVIAASAADACNLVIDSLRHVPCITCTTYGPKGGRVSRYHGYDMAIFHQMLDMHDTKQLPLF